MKTFINAVAIALLTALSQCTCEDTHEAPKPITELEKLPPSTQTGKNTFGCLVNGEAMHSSRTVPHAFYQHGSLSISMSAIRPERYIRISLQDTDDFVRIDKGTFSLVWATPFRPTVSVSFPNDCFYGYEFTGGTADLLDGQIVLTRMDVTNYVISGTFEFTTVTKGCDTLRVTNGRFDMQFVP